MPYDAEPTTPPTLIIVVAAVYVLRRLILGYKSVIEILF